jgi:hypothetical protein
MKWKNRLNYLPGKLSTMEKLNAATQGGREVALLTTRTQPRLRQESEAEV